MNGCHIQKKAATQRIAASMMYRAYMIPVPSYGAYTLMVGALPQTPRFIALVFQGSSAPGPLGTVMDILECYAERRIGASLWTLWIP